MNVTFNVNGFFQVEDEPNEIIISCNDDNGDTVNLRVRKSGYGGKWFGELVKDLSKVVEAKR